MRFGGVPPKRIMRALEGVFHEDDDEDDDDRAGKGPRPSRGAGGRVFPPPFWPELLAETRQRARDGMLIEPGHNALAQREAHRLKHILYSASSKFLVETVEFVYNPTVFDQFAFFCSIIEGEHQSAAGANLRELWVPMQPDSGLYERTPSLGFPRMFRRNNVRFPANIHGAVRVASEQTAPNDRSRSRIKFVVGLVALGNVAGGAYSSSADVTRFHSFPEPNATDPGHYVVTCDYQAFPYAVVTAVRQLDGAARSGDMAETCARTPARGMYGTDVAKVSAAAGAASAASGGASAAAEPDHVVDAQGSASMKEACSIM